MILVKTEAGQQALKDRSVRLTPRQRSAFILFDGKRSIDEVVGAGLGVSNADIEEMMVLGLVEPGPGAGASSPSPQTGTPSSASSPSVMASATPVSLPMQPEPSFDQRSPQERYQAAYPIATRLTAGLGLRGFRLNLQVEGTSNYSELAALAPRIREAVGGAKAEELDRALGD